MNLPRSSKRKISFKIRNCKNVLQIRRLYPNLVLFQIISWANLAHIKYQMLGLNYENEFLLTKFFKIGRLFALSDQLLFIFGNKEVQKRRKAKHLYVLPKKIVWYFSSFLPFSNAVCVLNLLLTCRPLVIINEFFSEQCLISSGKILNSAHEHFLTKQKVSSSHN